MIRRLTAFAGLLPIIGMGAAILIGFGAPDYSVVSQHMSELQLRGDYTTLVVQIGATLAGVGICAFGVLCTIAAGRFSFTALTALLFGAAMISNGLITMGSPWHGLMGLAIFSVLTPAFFVAEFPDWSGAPGFKLASLATALIGLGYMWILLVGLDPAELRGLTQRVSSVISFGWYGVAGLVIARRRSASAA
jgi:hypothetical protein